VWLLVEFIFDAAVSRCKNDATARRLLSQWTAPGGVDKQGLNIGTNQLNGPRRMLETSLIVVPK
jgi:hypothetical protein